MQIKDRAAQWLCKHRRSWPCAQVGKLAFLISRAYENRDFNMETNGEAWCLKRLKEGDITINCAFDVGANTGDWTAICRQNHPQSVIHAFEIAAPTFAKLQSNVGTLSHVFLNSFGLSNRTEEIDLFLPEAEKEIGRATSFKDHLEPEFEMPGQERTSFQKIRGKVIPGDDYVKTNKIEMIDFLKIDVEGMEETVLEGLANTFAGRKIRLVQFEYNTTNIVSKFLLRNAYQFFNRHGYAVGKLYPNYIEFRDYHYRHEDFCGPNMIAARSDDRDLLKLLGPQS
jgi:FkbM family methyltransferase